MIAACKNMAGTQKMATDCLTSDFSTTNLNGDDLKERRGRNLLHTLDWLQKLYRLLREWKVYICLEQTRHGRKIYWELLIQLKPSVIREIPEVQTAGGAESLRKFHCLSIPFLACLLLTLGEKLLRDGPWDCSRISFWSERIKQPYPVYSSFMG